jgi:hypothetical protein
VSGVLHPVGPERPTVYWLRRGVVIVIVAALVLLLVHAFAGGSPSHPAGGAGTHPSASPSPSGSAGIPRCTTDDLSVTLSTDKREYSGGESATFTGTFRNTSGSPCRLHSTVASRVWTVTSGEDTVWTTAGCSPTGSTTAKKLSGDRTATVSITWDGHRNDSSCTAGSVALPGTYVLKATFGGVKGAPAVFHVVS